VTGESLGTWIINKLGDRTKYGLRVAPRQYLFDLGNWYKDQVPDLGVEVMADKRKGTKE
jgi:hypothetical protein